MQLKILTLLFCCAVFGAIAVHGAHTQLRFMNAQLASQTNIGITTNRYQNGSLIIRSRVNPVFFDIPASPYMTLPSASISLNTTVQFFAYNADSAQIPVTSKAGINATLDAGSSYTLVYIDQSEYMWSSIAKFPAPKLLLFKERSASSGTFVKFVNVAVFTADQYSASSLFVYFAGARYNLTFGSQSSEVAVTPGLNYEVTAKLNSGNQTVQFTPAENSTTVIYFRGDYYYPMGFGYNIVTINGEGFVAESVLPVATPIAPNPLSTKIRLINGLSLETNLTMTIYDNGTPRFSYASVFGPYQTLTSGSGSYYVSIGDMSGEMFNTHITLTAGKTYSYVIGSRTEGVLLEDTPARDNNTAYMRVINCVQSINVTFVAYRTPTPYYQNWELFFGQSTGFFPGTAGANVQVSMNSLDWEEQSNYTLYFDTVTTVVALGDRTYFQLFADSQPLSSIDTPVSPYPTPVAAVPYSSSVPTAPSAPVAARFRLINSLSSINVTVTVWDNGFPRQSAGLYSGYYEYIYTSGSLYVEVSNDGVLMHTNYINVTLGKSYLYVVCAYSSGIFLEEAPTSYSPARSYVRVLNCMQISGPTTVEITLPDNYLVYNLSNSEYTDFVETHQGYYLVELSHEGYSLSNRTNFLANSSIMTFWLVDESYSGNVREESSGFQDASLFTHPDCYGYQDLTTGACVCYSGFYTTSYLRQCATPSPSSCYVNVTSKLDNDVVPFVIWGESQVYGNRLNLNIYSEMVSGRYTVIEFPNAQCNLLNSPQFYQKAVNGCLDVISLNVPFTECGFVKTSEQYADVYKGIIHVKQVDRYIQFGNYYQDRVIDTPFPVSINMPKTLAVSSDVQVFGPPSVAIDAAFIGQTVNTQTSSANLQYMSSVQYPLVIESIEVIDLPYGVSAWVEIVNVTCSMVGVPCLQRLELHLNTSSCTISGVYRLALSLICRSEVGCPDEAKNGTQVYLESRVVSQNLCSEVSVDIDLNGYIQAYTDSNFATQALAFYPGQSAYFLLNAYSSRVSLSSVTLASVYYYGPNVNFQYLLYENNVTSAAQSNNFTWGSLGTSQAWFSVDVSVGTPNSNDSTLFKLYQGQNAVYNFVAYVDVEWSVQANNATAPTSFKKRMALQSTGTNQNSQFSAQVQIAGPTPSAQNPPIQQQQPSPVETTPKNGQLSGATTTQFSYLALFAILVATFCLM